MQNKQVENCGRCRNFFPEVLYIHKQYQSQMIVVFYHSLLSMAGLLAYLVFEAFPCFPGF